MFGVPLLLLVLSALLPLLLLQSGEGVIGDGVFAEGRAC